MDWYYKIIQFFPDVQGELKSREVAERFKNFPAGIRNAIWVGLARVKIHTVDPRSHRHKINNILRRAWKNIDAPKLLSRWEKKGLPNARFLQLRKMVADSILRDSTAMRVQFLGRAFLDPFGMMKPDDQLKPFFVRSEKPSKPLISTEDFNKPKSLIRDAASWAAKSSAAFHSVLDAARFPDDDAVTYRFDVGGLVRRKMAQQLLPVHAFDDRNRKQLDLLDEARSSVFQELAANDHVYGLMIRRPGIVPVESKESFYAQAADIAAGIASHIYASEGLVGVVGCFEYVTQRQAMKVQDVILRALNGASPRARSTPVWSTLTRSRGTRPVWASPGFSPAWTPILNSYSARRFAGVEQLRDGSSGASDCYRTFVRKPPQTALKPFLNREENLTALGP